MIAVDTSAIIAIARLEPEATLFSEIIASRTTLVSAATLLETHMVLRHIADDAYPDIVQHMAARRSVRVVPLAFPHYQAAAAAFDRFGRGRHKAKLNFGDCLSYALARVEGVPLLYKGDDFAHTDIEPAWTP